MQLKFRFRNPFCCPLMSDKLPYFIAGPCGTNYDPNAPWDGKGKGLLGTGAKFFPNAAWHEMLRVGAHPPYGSELLKTRLSSMKEKVTRNDSTRSTLVAMVKEVNYFNDTPWIVSADPSGIVLCTLLEEVYKIVPEIVEVGNVIVLRTFRLVFYPYRRPNGYLLDIDSCLK